MTLSSDAVSALQGVARSFGRGRGVLDDDQVLEFRPGVSGEPSFNRVLAEALEREVAVPLLSVRSFGEFNDRLPHCLAEFSETRGALRVLARHGLARYLSWEQARDKLVVRAEELGGPDLARECELAATALHRAVNRTK